MGNGASKYVISEEVKKIINPSGNGTVTAYYGVTERGTTRPKLVKNWSEYQEEFGGLASVSSPDSTWFGKMFPATMEVYEFFAEGGGHLIVKRMVTHADKAAGDWTEMTGSCAGTISEINHSDPTYMFLGSDSVGGTAPSIEFDSTFTSDYEFIKLHIRESSVNIVFNVQGFKDGKWTVIGATLAIPGATPEARRISMYTNLNARDGITITDGTTIDTVAYGMFPAATTLYEADYYPVGSNNGSLELITEDSTAVNFNVNFTMGSLLDADDILGNNGYNYGDASLFAECATDQDVFPRSEENGSLDNVYPKTGFFAFDEFKADYFIMPTYELANVGALITNVESHTMSSAALGLYNKFMYYTMVHRRDAIFAGFDNLSTSKMSFSGATAFPNTVQYIDKDNGIHEGQCEMLVGGENVESVYFSNIYDVFAKSTLASDGATPLITFDPKKTTLGVDMTDKVFVPSSVLVAALRNKNALVNIVEESAGYEGWGEFSENITVHSTFINDITHRDKVYDNNYNPIVTNDDDVCMNDGCKTFATESANVQWSGKRILANRIIRTLYKIGDKYRHRPHDIAKEAIDTQSITLLRDLMLAGAFFSRTDASKSYMFKYSEKNTDATRKAAKMYWDIGFNMDSPTEWIYGSLVHDFVTV